MNLDKGQIETIPLVLKFQMSNSQFRIGKHSYLDNKRRLRWMHFFSNVAKLTDSILNCVNLGQ